MMNEYIKNGTTIRATEKAFNTIYKAQGYTLVETVEAVAEEIETKKKNKKEEASK